MSIFSFYLILNSKSKTFPEIVFNFFLFSKLLDTFFIFLIENFQDFHFRNFIFKNLLYFTFLRKGNIPFLRIQEKIHIFHLSKIVSIFKVFLDTVLFFYGFWKFILKISHIFHFSRNSYSIFENSKRKFTKTLFEKILTSQKF